MSMYTFKMAGDGLMELRRNGSVVLSIFPSEVPELASCVQVALSGVKAGAKCKCPLQHSKWKDQICGAKFDNGGDCNAPCINPMSGEFCGHDKACHQPQAQRREA